MVRRFSRNSIRACLLSGESSVPKARPSWPWFPLPGRAGVVEEIFLVALGGHGGDEADVLRIVDIIPAVEGRGAVGRGLEERPQCGDGPVVEVRGPEPDPVQRGVGIAVGLSEMREALGRVGRVELALVHAEVEGVGIQAVPVGLDLVDRGHLAHPLAREIGPARAVAARAVLGVDGLPLRDQAGVDGVGVRRRRGAEEPVLRPLDRRAVERRGKRAGPEGRAPVALVDRRVVAVPVELHPFPLLLVPDRREVADADPFRLGAGCPCGNS